MDGYLLTLRLLLGCQRRGLIDSRRLAWRGLRGRDCGCRFGCWHDWRGRFWRKRFGGRWRRCRCRRYGRRRCCRWFRCCRRFCQLLFVRIGFALGKHHFAHLLLQRFVCLAGNQIVNCTNTRAFVRALLAGFGVGRHQQTRRERIAHVGHYGRRHVLFDSLLQHRFALGSHTQCRIVKADCAGKPLDFLWFIPCFIKRLVKRALLPNG